MNKDASQQMIDILYKPKKAKLRDLVGITIYGIGVSLMSPAWRRYNMMIMADAAIRKTSEELRAAAKVKARDDRAAANGVGQATTSPSEVPHGYRAGMD